MHARTHTCMHAQTHACTDTRTCMHSSTCMRAHTCMHVHSCMHPLMHNALKVHGIFGVTYTGNVGFLDVCPFFVSTPHPTENNEGGCILCMSRLRCKKILSGPTLLRTSQGKPGISLVTHLAIIRKLLTLDPRKMGKMILSTVISKYHLKSD